MSRFVGFGDYYDLTVLKQNASKIMDKFTPEQQEAIKEMAKCFEQQISNCEVTSE